MVCRRITLCNIRNLVFMVRPGDGPERESAMERGADKECSLFIKIKYLLAKKTQIRQIGTLSYWVRRPPPNTITSLSQTSCLMSSRMIIDYYSTTFTIQLIMLTAALAISTSPPDPHIDIPSIPGQMCFPRDPTTW